jgi:hypothetical protein
MKITEINGYLKKAVQSKEGNGISFLKTGVQPKHETRLANLSSVKKFLQCVLSYLMVQSTTKENNQVSQYSIKKELIIFVSEC